LRCLVLHARPMVRTIAFRLIVVLVASVLVGCSPRPQGVVLIDPYLSGLLSDDDIAGWQRAASSEGLKLELVHLLLPDDGGPLFDQMHAALESGDNYQVVLVTPVLLREAELLAELSADHLQDDIVVLGVGEDYLSPGLRGVAFDRAPAYRHLGEFLAEKAGNAGKAVSGSVSEGAQITDLVLFFAYDTPEARSSAAALGLGVDGRVEIQELWYTTVPDQERIRRDIHEWRSSNTVMVFALGSAAPAALRVSQELSLPSVFEAGASEYENVLYSVEFPFAHLVAAAVRGERMVPAVIGSRTRPVGR